MVKKYYGAVIVYNGGGSGSGLEIAKSFNSWIVGDEISDYAADINNADSVAAMFDSIKEDIMYMVAEGVVTDIITDDFTLVDNSGNDTFKLTVGGETIPGTKDGNTWTFGENYKVTYYPDENKFEWAINVPIENANPLTLSYKLRLNECAEDGKSYDTNVSAVLDYTTSDGKDGSFTFEIPVATYKEPKPTPTQLTNSDSNTYFEADSHTGTGIQTEVHSDPYAGLCSNVPDGRISCGLCMERKC